MMSKFEYVTKPLELKKETKDPTATTKKNNSQSKTTSPETQPKTCISKEDFLCAVLYSLKSAFEA